MCDSWQRVNESRNIRIHDAHMSNPTIRQSEKSEPRFARGEDNQ